MANNHDAADVSESDVETITNGIEKLDTSTTFPSKLGLSRRIALSPITAPTPAAARAPSVKREESFLFASDMFSLLG